MPAEKGTKAEPEKSSEGAEREAPRPPGVSMNQDTDPDSGEAPDTTDRAAGKRRVRSLPGPRRGSTPPALGPPAPTVELPPERTPAAEVTVSPGHVYVTVELPGVLKDDVDLEATERSLSVVASRTGSPAYRLQIDLPSPVDPESAKATCRNGVLDVTLDRPRRSGGDAHGA